MPSPVSLTDPRLLAWPDEIEPLARRIVLLEREASFAICDPLHGARLRQECVVLAGRLEAMKRLALATETAA